MLCQLCLFEFTEMGSAVPPATAAFVVCGPMLVKPMALCIVHTNASEDDQENGYHVLPIDSEAAQPFLTTITAGEKK